MQVVHDLKGEQISASQTEAYGQSLYFSVHHLIQSFYRKDDNSVIGLKHLFFNESLNKSSIAEIKKLTKVENIPLKLQHSLYNSPRFTLVPEKYFDVQDIEKYFKLNYQAQEHEEIRSEKLSFPDAWLIFGSDFNYSKIMLGLKPIVSRHFLSYWLNLIHSLTENTTGNHICLHIENNFFLLCVIQDARLILVNSYPVLAPEDILYHTLNVSKYLHLDTQKDNYSLSGFIRKEGDLFELLSNYILNLDFIKAPLQISFHPVLKDLPFHTYFPVFANHL